MVTTGPEMGFPRKGRGAQVLHGCRQLVS